VAKEEGDDMRLRKWLIVTFLNVFFSCHSLSALVMRSSVPGRTNTCLKLRDTLARKGQQNNALLKGAVVDAVDNRPAPMRNFLGAERQSELIVIRSKIKGREPEMADVLNGRHVSFHEHAVGHRVDVCSQRCHQFVNTHAHNLIQRAIICATAQKSILGESMGMQTPQLGNWEEDGEVATGAG